MSSQTYQTLPAATSFQHLTSLLTHLTYSNALNAVGLLVLADLEVAAKRTLLRGNSIYLDALALIPGMHLQLTAPEMSKGEHPACAAMTTGYVFRVENSATVYFLQRLGRTGQLTTLRVRDVGGTTNEAWSVVCDFRGAGLVSRGLYCVGIAMSGGFLLGAIRGGDWSAVVAVCMMVLARGLLTYTIRCRAAPGWFGALEPGVQSDLLVLLSQDRWVRIQGPTDDVKAVTSGTWLREPTALERSLGGFAKFLVFLGVVIFMGAGSWNKVLFFGVLSVSALCAHASNEAAETLTMHGRVLEKSGTRVKYERRLEMAHELIKEFGRTDCFVGMGIIQPHQAEEFRKKTAASTDGEEEEASYKKPVTM